MVFEKTLSDLVKGIRASKRDTALFISSCIAEIKSEISSTDAHVKANALQKLTFLQMMGYHMSWASFATIEVMSSTRFAHKRIGYLAASQAFTQDTDVILLTINLLKKELRAAMVVGGSMNGVYEAGLAINCLSNIVTEDLARELLPDVTQLTLHPQPYLRKKAILCLLKLFMKYPQGLRLTFPRIQEVLLNDTNSSVTSCAVNVITELSDKNPKNYLVLAPSFFALLTNSSNNWMLIKVVKLLGSLVPEEPRLARKLLEPLANIVQSTQAKSLLYESVHTITLCLPYCIKADGSIPTIIPSIVELCAQTLKSFVQEEDQNLKYLGLVGFGSLMISHPKVLSASDYRPLILACLSDEDVTIRTRALDLLIGLVTRKNLMDLISQLLHHVDMASGVYKIDLVEKIVELCSSEKYSLVSDFAWYLDVLVILARTKGLDGHGVGKNLGPLISSQMIDVTLRVLPVRPYAVRRMIGILLDGENAGLGSKSGTFGFETNASVLLEVLPAAATIVGEYSKLIDESVGMEIQGDDDDELVHYNMHSQGTHHAILQSLTDVKNVNVLSHQAQSIYIQAAMKLFSAATSSPNMSASIMEACIQTLERNLPIYAESVCIEVQERAVLGLRILNVLGLRSKSLTTCSTRMQSSNAHISSENLLNLDQLNPKGGMSETQSTITDPIQSIQEKCKVASTTLQYMYIPEQMKPISTKAQRKKISLSPSHVADLLRNTSTDSILLRLQRNEETRRQDHGIVKIESVDFTNQVRPKVAQDSHLTNVNDITDIFKMQEQPNGGVNRSHVNASAPLKVNDPFYLNTHITNSNISNEVLSKFGTIALEESDSDEDKKKKRKKKGKKQVKEMGAVDIEVLSGPANSDFQHRIPVIQASIIDSDDDEDDTTFTVARKSVSKSRNNGFEGLAMVDLTTPLREDEVMPISEHRTVVSRISNSNEDKAVEKTIKREKKSKKSKSSSKKVQTSNLLEIPDEIHNGNIASHFSAPSNPISSAFDDLLSLYTSEPNQNNNPALGLHNGVSKSRKSISIVVPEVWQTAVIKPDHKSPLFPEVVLYYKTKKSEDETMRIAFRILNVSQTPFQSVEIQLNGENLASSDTISRDELKEIGEMGPFHIQKSELVGNVIIGSKFANIKILFPKILEMEPWDVRQDDVGRVLSTGEWYSSSVRMEQLKMKPQKVKKSLMQYLSSYEVSNESLSDSNYMFASSTTTDKVLILVKVSSSGIKFDIKSTDKKLGKLIASDFKRLVL